MKKVLALLFVFAMCLTAEDNVSDTSVTIVPISDVKYYDVQYASDNMEIDHEVSDKPFALIQPNDKWFSKDKWMHLTSSYFLTLQSSFALEKMFYTQPENSRYISVGISLTFSIGKEFYDTFGKKSIFSWKDLVYDLLGTGLGYLTSTALQK